MRDSVFANRVTERLSNSFLADDFRKSLRAKSASQNSVLSVHDEVTKLSSWKAQAVVLRHTIHYPEVTIHSPHQIELKSADLLIACCGKCSPLAVSVVLLKVPGSSTTG